MNKLYKDYFDLEEMKYIFSPELQAKAEEICRLLFPHIDTTRVKCFVSEGSSTRRTIARCHTIGKLMQKTIGVPAHYGIEFISKAFDRLPEDEKTKVIIHELMHIPKTFSGALVSHRGHKHRIDRRSVEALYRQYVQNKNQS